MSFRSNFAGFAATLAAGMLLIVTAADVYAKDGGGGDSHRHEANVVATTGKVGPGGNTQGTGTPGTCKGPACNAKPGKGVSTTCGITTLTGGFGVLYERTCY